MIVYPPPPHFTVKECLSKMCKLSLAKWGGGGGGGRAGWNAIRYQILIKPPKKIKYQTPKKIKYQISRVYKK